MSRRFLCMLSIGVVLATPAWYLVSFQLVHISSEESLFYRFLFGALFIEIFRRLIREEKPPHLSLHMWGLMTAQGTFIYGINFWLCY